MSQVFTTMFVIQVLSAIVFSSPARAKDASIRVFKSDLGYEITLPSCLKIEPDVTPLDDNPDLKKVDILIHESSATKCSFKQKPVLLGIRSSGELENNESIEKWTERRTKIANQRERMGGSPYLLVKDKIYPRISYFTAERQSGLIVLKAFVVCGKNTFELVMADEISKFNEDIVSRIKKGDPSIPEVEAKIVESFKCLDKP